MKHLRNTHASSELVGEIFLFAIAAVCISIISFHVLSTLEPPDSINVEIIGYLENGCPVFELQRGESLGPDTRILITLAGFEQKQFLQKDVDDQEWDIGERIVLPVDNTKGVQVEATIVDAKTNSIVFFGVLQEGVTFGSKGGIWHFDENSWMIDIPDEVKDSSGNNNHGMALNGAKIINGILEPQKVKSNNSGFFNGYFDAVEVKTSWTLDMVDSVTVEAWMKPQIRETKGDLVEVEGDFGYNPYVINVVGDVYAMVSEDSLKIGRLSTVRISALGEIDRIQSVIFGSAKAKKTFRPIITQISEDLYLVSYNDWDGYIHMRTYKILSNGSITYTGYEKICTDYYIENDPNRPNRPSQLRISDNICAIAYWGKNINDIGILKTLDISPNGKINIIETITYEPGYDPCLIRINWAVYALAYRDVSNHGIIKTFNINPIGQIKLIDENVYSGATFAYQPSLIKVSENFIAVVYRDDQSLGYVKIINISSNGIIQLTNETEVFESTIGYCFNPCIIHIDDDKYVIAYSTADNSGYSLGYVVTLKLWNNGSIGPIDPRVEFEVSEGVNTRCFNPIILRIKNYLFAVSYEGFGNHPGKLITTLIGKVPKGICKDFSYMINANTTMVECCVDNVFLEYHNDSLGLDWHHIVLTYDGLSIYLYVDGIKVNETSYPNHRIDLTDESLFFGRFYCGFIDEIVIYEKALTEEQIFNHFMYPGTF